MALKPQRSLGAAFTGVLNRNSFGVLILIHFHRERNNGKIIRACDTEASSGGGVQYHKCYDQDGRMTNTIMMMIWCDAHADHDGHDNVHGHVQTIAYSLMLANLKTFQRFEILLDALTSKIM